MIEKGKLTEQENDATLEGSLNTGNEPFQFTELESDDRKTTAPDSMNLDLLLDIPLEVVVELGRTRMRISEVLELTSGSIVELDKMAGEPVDVFVNNRLIARGEVVVIEEHFGVRITEICQAPI